MKTSSPTDNPPPQTQNLIDFIKDSGYSDEDIKSLKQYDQTANPLDKDYFVAVDIKILSALQYFNKLDENSKKLIYTQAPISLLRTIGDSNNWENGNYVGFGAEIVDSILNQDLEDIRNITMDAMALAILIVRAKVFQKRIEQQIQYIEDINKELAEINTMISRASTLKAEADDDTSKMSQDMIDFWNKYEAKIVGTDNKHTSTDWDANIRALKTVSEEISSKSQIETTKLQQDINKFNQTFELLNSILKKLENTGLVVAKH